MRPWRIALKKFAADGNRLRYDPVTSSCPAAARTIRPPAMTRSVQPWWSTRSFAIAMMIAAAVPLLWPTVPPLVDLPGHMGRYAIQLAPASSPLHQWFHFEWAVIGNLGLDLLVMPLAWLIGLEPAVKLIVVAIPPLTVAGMLLVAREAHGELPATAPLALPLVYGYPVQFGFVNFALSMALALIGFAVWLRLGRQGRLKLRAILFIPFGILLWFVHSFGWGTLGLLTFSGDLVRRHRRGKPWLQSAWEAGLATMPLMPPIMLMLLWRSGQVAGMTGDWFNWISKWYYLRSILRNDGTPFDLYSSYALIAIALLGLLGFGFRRNWLLVLAATILIATYVLLPRIAIGSAYADMRLAPYMIAVLLLALSPKTGNPRALGLIAIAATGFFLVRMAVQTATYVRVDAAHEAQLAALDHLPRGARVFALADLPCLNTPYSNRFDHLEAMGIVRREAFTNGQWAMAGAQLLRIDYPAAAAFSQDPSQVIRPANCKQPNSNDYPAVLGEFTRSAFDYLWLINFPVDRQPRNDAGLVPVWRGSTGALYRIRRTPTAG